MTRVQIWTDDPLNLYRISAGAPCVPLAGYTLFSYNQSRYDKKEKGSSVRYEYACHADSANR